MEWRFEDGFAAEHLFARRSIYHRKGDAICVCKIRTSSNLKMTCTTSPSPPKHRCLQTPRGVVPPCLWPTRGSRRDPNLWGSPKADVAGCQAGETKEGGLSRVSMLTCHCWLPVVYGCCVTWFMDASDILSAAIGSKPLVSRWDPCPRDNVG